LQLNAAALPSPGMRLFAIQFSQRPFLDAFVAPDMCAFSHVWDVKWAKVCLACHSQGAASKSVLIKMIAKCWPAEAFKVLG